jgi:hypothetical protein
MAFGPLQIIALGFPSTDRFEGRIAAELFKASDAGVIRIVDALAVRVEGDEVDILRLSDHDEQEAGAAGIEGFVAGAEVGAEIADEGGFGLVEAVADELAEELPDGSAGLLLIIEHAWAVPFRDAVIDAGGILLANRWIGVQDLVMIGAALRATADEDVDA